ncbi:MAG: pyridoxal phosphate-dependent decarboxylase family protein, partial [Flammeovirgaceae bacterium]
MENKESLDYSLETFHDLLLKSNEFVLNKFEEMHTAKAFSGVTPAQVQAWFDEPIPKKGMEPLALLDFVKEKVLDTATMNIGPNMYAYVMTGGNQISILAEKLAATINQNVGKWHLAPVMSELEKRVVQWGADFIGYGPNVGGVMTSGGSAANLVGLTVARNIYFEHADIRKKGLFGMKPFMVYASDEVHGCIDKSIELLGIGMDNYRKIPTHSDFTIDLEALEEQINQDLADGYQPFCLIGNAGTVNTGAIDPLWRMAQIAKKYKLWFHVDGAYGALAAATETVGGLYRGIEQADSL